MDLNEQKLPRRNKMKSTKEVKFVELDYSEVERKLVADRLAKEKDPVVRAKLKTIHFGLLYGMLPSDLRKKVEEME